MFGVLFHSKKVGVFGLVFAMYDQFPALREFVKIGKPVWGTCAGLIFLANKATGWFCVSVIKFLLEIVFFL